LLALLGAHHILHFSRIRVKAIFNAGCNEELKTMKYFNSKKQITLYFCGNEFEKNFMPI
jgi:hypothetical protein